MSAEYAGLQFDIPAHTESDPAWRASLKVTTRITARARALGRTHRGQVER